MHSASVPAWIQMPPLSSKALPCIFSLRTHIVFSRVCARLLSCQCGLLAVPASMFLFKAFRHHCFIPSYKILYSSRALSGIISFMETSLISPLDGSSCEAYHSWFLPNLHSLSSTLAVMSVHFSSPQGQGQRLVHLCTHTLPDIPDPAKSVKLNY